MGVQGVNTELYLPAPKGDIGELSYAITPIAHGEPDGYFWAFQFAVAGGDIPTGGYFGIQNNHSSLKQRCAIFSLWQADGGQKSLVPGSICQPFSGEGNGWQSLIPFNWVKDKTYRLKAVAEPDSWYAAYINGTMIGKLRLPKARNYKRFSTWAVCWTERFLPSQEKPIPAEAIFEDFRADGLVPTNITTHLGGAATYGSSFQSGVHQAIGYLLP